MPSKHQRAVLAAAVLFLVLLAVLIQRGAWKGGLFEAGKINDFHAYHAAARGVWQRDLAPSYRDPARANLYPPPFAILVAPLGLLPYRVALAVWVSINAALVVYMFRGMERILGLPLSLVARLAGFLLAYRFLESDFSNGNANTLVVASTLFAFDWTRRRGGAVAGGILALPILAKVAPVLILPWLIYRARWRMLAGCIAGLVILGLVLPVAVLGLRGARDAWSAWRSVTLDHIDPASESYGAEIASGYEPGQSLRTLVHRILRRSDATSHDGEVVPINALDLPKRTADLVYALLAAGVLLAALAAAWRRTPGRRLGWGAGEIAAACAVMVLIAPLSRKAHFVALWPAAVLGLEAWRLSEGKKLRAVGAVLWALALVLVVGTSPGLAGRELSRMLLAYCPASWAAVALLVLVSYPGFFPRGGRTVADIAREGNGCAGAQGCGP